MPEAYIVEAVRTAVGKRNGSLAGVHPIDLAARVFQGLFKRVDVDPGAVDDVVVGCVDAIGGQSGNIARTSWLAAGYPEEVPGVTVDRQCGSSQQAISFGAQAIMAGTADIILAGGVQSMSRIPISSARRAGEQYGFTTATAESEGWQRRYGDEEISQFPRCRTDCAEMEYVPGGDGGVRAVQSRACAIGHPGQAFRQRDRTGRRLPHRRRAA